jgi:Ca-activated chloride channel homolog
VFEWASPWWFAALPAALFPLGALLRPWTLRFSSLSSMRSGFSLRTTVHWIPSVVESAVIVLVIFALARPQIVSRETERESEGVDIVLAIDTSGSMDAPDMGGAGMELTRLEAAKRVMQAFVEARVNDRVALVVFGKEAFTQVPLTLDKEGMHDFLGQLQIGVAGKQATAVGDAIAVACKRLKELEAPSKVVILVTDGKSNAGQIEPLVAARAAAALGIRVYTIGVGSASSRRTGPFGLLTTGAADVDEPTLRQVATLTGGEYFRAGDTAALAEVYARIDALEPSPAKVRQYVDRDERFADFLYPAIGLWLLNLLLVTGPLRRTP